MNRLRRTRPDVKTLNVNPGSGGRNIAREKYDALRRAILAAVPATREGIRFLDLFGAVAERLPRQLFRGASVQWYTTTVKLDLEARGLIERVPGAKPQRLRRPRAAPTPQA